MADLPTIATARLELRPFRPLDAPRVAELAGAREIADTTARVPHPYVQAMADDWIAGQAAEFERGAGVTFAITLRENGELVGAIGLGLEPELRSGVLGYWIGVPYWNRGYATEAARAVIGYGFGALDLERISATYFTRNPASGRVMEKTGMRHEGVLRRSARKWDILEDVAHRSILREEWPGEP